jgi:hypothetical protein
MRENSFRGAIVSVDIRDSRQFQRRVPALLLIGAHAADGGAQ